MQQIFVVPEEKGFLYQLPWGLSAEQIAAAEDIALADPRVQAMLDGADDYRIQVSGIPHVKSRTENGNLIITIDFEEAKAVVAFRIYKEYDQEAWA